MNNTVSTTCTTSPRTSPNSTGGTPTLSPSSTASTASGSIEGLAGSASMHSRPCCTTVRSATTRPHANDSAKERDLGQRFAFNANRPEVHDLVRRWRRLADGYDQPRLLFGETWVPTVEQLADYYGNGRDELHLAWNLPFLGARFQAGDLSQVIGHTIQTLPSDAIPAWAISTHDGEGRAATRWCNGDDNAIRCALVRAPRPPRDVDPLLRRRDWHDSTTTRPSGTRPALSGRRAVRVAYANAMGPWRARRFLERPTVAPGRRHRRARTSPTRSRIPRPCCTSVRDLIQVRTKLPPERMYMLVSPAGMLAWRCSGADHRNQSRRHQD